MQPAPSTSSMIPKKHIRYYFSHPHFLQNELYKSHELLKISDSKGILTYEKLSNPVNYIVFTYHSWVHLEFFYFYLHYQGLAEPRYPHFNLLVDLSVSIPMYTLFAYTDFKFFLCWTRLTTSNIIYILFSILTFRLILKKINHKSGINNHQKL